MIKSSTIMQWLVKVADEPASELPPPPPPMPLPLPPQEPVNAEDPLIASLRERLIQLVGSQDRSESSR